jgi:hypothetical protein
MPLKFENPRLGIDMKLKYENLSGVSIDIIPTRFPNFAEISPTRWLLERSRIWRLVIKIGNTIKD